MEGGFVRGFENLDNTIHCCNNTSRNCKTKWLSICC